MIKFKIINVEMGDQTIQFCQKKLTDTEQQQFQALNPQERKKLKENQEILNRPDNETERTQTFSKEIKNQQTSFLKNRGEMTQKAYQYLLKDEEKKEFNQANDERQAQIIQNKLGWKGLESLFAVIDKPSSNYDEQVNAIITFLFSNYEIMLNKYFSANQIPLEHQEGEKSNLGNRIQNDLIGGYLEAQPGAERTQALNKIIDFIQSLNNM